jgi:hypothetical protein
MISTVYDSHDQNASQPKDACDSAVIQQLTDKETAGDAGTHQQMMIDNPVDGGVDAEDIDVVILTEEQNNVGVEGSGGGNGEKCHSVKSSSTNNYRVPGEEFPARGIKIEPEEVYDDFADEDPHEETYSATNPNHADLVDQDIDGLIVDDNAGSAETSTGLVNRDGQPIHDNETAASADCTSPRLSDLYGDQMLDSSSGEERVDEGDERHEVDQHQGNDHAPVPRQLLTVLMLPMAKQMLNRSMIALPTM